MRGARVRFGFEEVKRVGTACPVEVEVDAINGAAGALRGCAAWSASLCLCLYVCCLCLAPENALGHLRTFKDIARRETPKRIKKNLR